MKELKILQEQKSDLVGEFESLLNKAENKELITSESKRLAEIETLIADPDEKIKPLAEEENSKKIRLEKTQ